MNLSLKRIRRLRGKKGAAMVEFSLMMLAFVPLILLPLYFSEAMCFKLDLQEAVHSITWDFAFGDYTKKSAGQLAGSAQQANRNIYMNLRSGDTASDFATPWASFQWDEQLTCTVDTDFGADVYSGGLLDMTVAGYFHDEYTKGGLVKCYGTIGVANQYVPNSFMDDQQWTDRKFFNMPKGSFIRYPTTRSGIMVDPWCIHNPADLTDQDSNNDDGGNEEFHERVKFVWKEALLTKITYLASLVVCWELFAIEMLADISLVTAAYWPDDPKILHVSSKHLGNTKESVSVSGGRRDYYVTPYEDGDNNDYQETFERDDNNGYYLGCASFGHTCNPSGL